MFSPLHAILNFPKNGGCTERKKDLWSSDGHRTAARKSSTGGFTCVRRLDIVKMYKTLIIYSVSCFNSGKGYWSIGLGDKSTKASPAAMGLDGHLTNITHKQVGKCKLFILPDRYGFKTCEKLTHWVRAKKILRETMWLFLKSTDLVYLCTPHHGGTPLESLVHPGVYDTAGWQVAYFSRVW